mmetsp:Transcript_23842/g.56169  ORF Transcript_23842/g.56169 Transcript_23842/m.56169 type:complete len:251 (+) Transcript_23842:306-1058(+)
MLDSGKGENVENSPKGKVDQEASNEPVRNGICEGHEHDSNKGREGVVDPVPLNQGQSAAHEGTNNNKSTSSSPGGDTGENWRKEDGNEEVERAHDRGEAGLAAGFHTGSALDVRRDGAETKERANHGGDGIHSEGLATLWEVSILVGDAEGGDNGKHSAGGVEEINEEESGEGDSNSAQVARVLDEQLVDWLQCHDLFKVVESCIPGVGFGEEGHGGVAEPRDESHEQNSDNNTRVFLVSEHDSHDHHSQ